MNADEHGSAFIRVLDFVARGESVVLVTALGGPAEHRVIAAAETGEFGDIAREALRSGKPRVVTIGNREYYFEPYAAPPSVVICGAGHIAVPLSRMAAFAGCTVTVIDDRADYANARRFPDAATILAEPFADALARTPMTPNTAVVLVTRGHRYDWDCLRAVIGRGAGYIGMIGSRRRVKAALLGLEREGIPASGLARIAAPIGLDIGAETPEEIAVAILAEIILSRRTGTGRPLSAAGPG